MTEPTITLNDAEEAVLHEPGEYNSVARVWLEILRPSYDLAHEKVSPNWALHVVNTYPEMTFRKTSKFQAIFYGIFQEFLDGLDALIDAREGKVLKVADAAEDLEENREFYLQVIETWQKTLRTREIAWDNESENAAEILAAISEVNRIAFGQDGFVNYLDSIKLEVTEEEQEQLATVLATLEEEGA